MLYFVVYRSPYGNHGEGRGVCVWSKGLSTVLDLITKRASLGRIVRVRGCWRTKAVGDSDLGPTVLGLLADRDLGHEESCELTAGSKGLLRAVLDVRHAPLQRVEPGLGTVSDLCLLPLLRQLSFDGV